MKKITTNLVEFDDLTIPESVSWVIEQSAQVDFKYVVTPNVDHLVRLIESDGELTSIYADSNLCLCDSRILKVMMHKKNYPIQSVVPGSDLTAALFSSDAMNEKHILIFGGDDAVFTKLKDTYPHLNLSHINPSMGFIKRTEEVEILSDEIAALKPDILFLAVGSPQQEKFARHLQQNLSHGVALCIGASILFITGGEKRAPVIFQKLHLEWLFRMIVAPRLISRYWSNFLSLGKIYKNM